MEKANTSVRSIQQKRWNQTYVAKKLKEGEKVHGYLMPVELVEEVRKYIKQRVQELEQRHKELNQSR